MAVLVLPIAAVMAVFVIFCTRVAAVRLDLNSAASAAARAASLARTEAAAYTAASEAARANLAGHRHTCDPLVVTVDGGDFRRGGRVAVTLSCRMATAELTGLGLPGSLTCTATAYAVIDTHRVTGRGT
ncbi:hypothetical protein GCM10009557_00370 [Virgisporangium ochraceum]|uniref:TadE family protein n=2 Tax=Virgisporangium ochraceum TaxID=65505 RepID=A0A8J4A1F9_9ACTN|nr:hypothetical protein Voc01_089860 [Virgisporangium ochraceum]